MRMLQVSRSTQNHCRRVSVIPVELILQSTHLFPKFPASVFNADWASEHVYQQATTFYVNPFIRHYDFFRFEDELALPHWQTPD